MNTDLLNDFLAYGEKHKSFDMVFMQGFTLRQCVDLLSKVKTEILTDGNYAAIKNTKSKMRIDEILKNIEIQIKHHSEVRAMFDYFINPKP